VETSTPVVPASEKPDDRPVDASAGAAPETASSLPAKKAAAVSKLSAKKPAASPAKKAGAASPAVKKAAAPASPAVKKPAGTFQSLVVKQNNASLIFTEQHQALLLRRNLQRQELVL
jgi:hypothetical protein